MNKIAVLLGLAVAATGGFAAGRYTVTERDGMVEVMPQVQRPTNEEATAAFKKSASPLDIPSGRSLKINLFNCTPMGADILCSGERDLGDIKNARQFMFTRKADGEWVYIPL
jgi:hypothetical protein